MAHQKAFSTALLEVAVYYVYARVAEADLSALEQAGRQWFNAGADGAQSKWEQELDTLALVFENLGVDGAAGAADRILHTALGMRLAGKDAKQTTLSVSKYDRERKKILAELNLASSQGALLWPPTSQTILARMGGKWSAAMEATGLAASSDGKIGRKNTRFTDQDRERALRAYLRHCEVETLNPSYSGYTKWARQQDFAPSGAAIRQAYGTWQKALNQVQ
ncbi:MAG: hypothetical protein Q4D87_05085 [Actinomycetaceae bacterium]|nr:hypothetical protein [Actinomycetaceae bacterium]